jgi:hypothetical protein
MTPLLSEIKRKVQNMVCSEHGEQPEVTILGDKIEFKCCCETFKRQLLEVSKVTFGNHAKDTFSKMLKDAFKGSKHIKFK